MKVDEVFRLVLETIRISEEEQEEQHHSPLMAEEEARLVEK